jgi:hypothetical protein
MSVPTLLATLSWAGFISAGFVLWAEGNTNGGYSMAGIATALPFVVAAAILLLNAKKTTPLVQGVPLLLTLSWLGFIISGFMLWYTGNTNGGYSMIGIAIILPALVAALIPLVPRITSGLAGASASTAYILSWLFTLSWAGFLVCGFVLWYYGNTNGGYSMVGIAICLPAVIASGLAGYIARAPAAKAAEPVVSAVAVDAGVVTAATGAKGSSTSEAVAL